MYKLIDLHGDISRITFSEFPGCEVPDCVQGLVWNGIVENLHVLVAPVAVNYAAVPLLRCDPHLCNKITNFFVETKILKRQIYC
jgi:hypothetical protein